MLTGGTFQKEQEGTSLPGATDPPCPQAQGCSVCRRMLGHPLIVVPWGSTRGCLRPRTCGTLTGPPSNRLGNQTRKGPAASMLPGQWFSGHCDWTRAPGSSWEACGSKGTRQSLGRPGYAVQTARLSLVLHAARLKRLPLFFPFFLPLAPPPGSFAGSSLVG